MELIGNARSIGLGLFDKTVVKNKFYFHSTTSITDIIQAYEGKNKLVIWLKVSLYYISRESITNKLAFTF